MRRRMSMSSLLVQEDYAPQSRILSDQFTSLHDRLGSNLLVSHLFGRRCLGSRLHEAVVLFLQVVYSIRRKCEVTKDAVVLVAGRLAVAPGTFDRPDFGRFFILDIDTMQPRVFAFVAFVAEPGHVPSRVVTPPLSTLSVLDPWLEVPLEDEPAGVRLPEVRGGDLLRDASAVGGILEELSPRVVRRSLWLAELCPHVVPVVARMLVEPLLGVRDRHDEVNGALAGLAVDVDADRVFAVEYVADSKVEEFAAPKSRLQSIYDTLSGSTAGHVSRRVSQYE